jgi:hypothetical protein
MQLLTGDVIDNQHYAMVAALAPPIVEAKDEQHSLSLVEKILSKIRSLPEGRQASLFALLKPNLEGEKLRVVFNRLLALKVNLARTLAIIDFLFSLKDKFDTREALREILKFIANSENKEEKLLAIEAFITKAKAKKAKVERFDSFSLESAIKDLVIRVNGCDFELKDKINLIGRLFDLAEKDKSHQLIAMQEYYKDELIKSINSLENSSEKYLALLGMLKSFPLEEKEISELACFALGVLREGNSEKPNDDNGRSSVRLEEKVRLLGFLPKQHHKSFGKELYEELCKSEEPIVNDIINISLFVNNYYCDTREENWDLFDLGGYAIGNIYHALDYVCNCSRKNDYEYFALVELLTSEKWTEDLGWSEIWISDVLELVKSMKFPIMQVDSLLLLLEKIKPSKLKKEIVNQSLKRISLIEEQAERIMLTSKLIKYLPKKTGQKILCQYIEKLKCCWNKRSKAELLMALLPCLTGKLRNEAFCVANNISNEFDKSWACVGFAPYLSKSKKRQVISDGLSLIERPISVSKKTLLIKQIIKFGLEPVNQG